MSNHHFRSDKNEDLYAPYDNGRNDYSQGDGYGGGGGGNYNNRGGYSGGRGGGRGGFGGGGRGFNKRVYDDYGGGYDGHGGGAGSFHDGRNKKGRFEEDYDSQGSWHGGGGTYHSQGGSFRDDFAPDDRFGSSSSFHDSRGDGGSFRGGHGGGGGHRERKPLHPPSAPSQSVIFLGLPPHVDDNGLRVFLESMGAVIDSTTIILDKVTGLSKRFGFAKFGSVEHARSFVEPNWPYIQWRDDIVESSGEKFRIKIDYSQNLEKPSMSQPGVMGDKSFNKGWQHDRFGESQEEKRSQAIINDGTRDIGASPTACLLIRGLDPLTADEDVGNSVLTVPVAGIKEGGLRQVRVIKDRKTRASWGYAFLQFSDVQLASNVLAAILSPQTYPTGFRISGTAVAVSFSHQNSFVPVYSTSSFSFKDDSGTDLMYWDENGFVSVWTSEWVKTEKSKVTPNASGNGAGESTNEDSEMAAFLSSLDDSPFSGTLQDTQSQSQIGPQIPTTAAEAQSSPAVGDGAAESKPGIGPIKLKPTTVADVSKDKKKIGSEHLVGAKKTAAKINRWNTKKKELQGAATPAENTKATLPSSNNNSESTTPPRNQIEDFEYGNVEKLTCLLCMRQFKSVLELKKHNDLSKLHKAKNYQYRLAFSEDNLQDEAKCSAAKARKEAAAALAASTPPATSTVEEEPTETPATETTSEGPKYRDRAAERRQALGQPEVPVLEPKTRRFAEGPAPPEPIIQPNKDGIEENNIGSKMLAAMGWNKGSGLGATGSGRTDPVMAYAHAQGVGLGAAKPILAGQYEDSARGYAESVRDRARDRLMQSE